MGFLLRNLHKLTDDREGRLAIAINDQWRICFRFDDGDAFEARATHASSGV